MNTKTIVGLTAAVAALGLVGCGSDSSTEATATSATETSSSSTSTAPPPSAPPSTPPPAAVGALTIADYLKDAGITETPARPGDPGAPKIDLPIPVGWEQAIDVPGDAFWAVTWTETPTPEDPPIIEATLSKLSADVPVGPIFEYAPGDLTNLPGYQAMGDGGRGELGGLEAHQQGGLFEDKGVSKLVAQKTLRIPAAGGTYLLRVRATGPEDQAPALIEATGDLDDGTVITP